MHVLDRIERKILLDASRKQVWEALTDAEQFGDWFGIALKGKTFVVGQNIEAPITYPGYEHAAWKARIERILPQTLFSFWWHPFAVERGGRLRPGNPDTGGIYHRGPCTGHSAACGRVRF